MKRILVSLMLVLGLVAFAAESAPSSTVGYVKYSLATTAGTDLNLISYPLEAGLTQASDLDVAGTVIDQVSKWDATNQGWVTATKGFFGWNGSFPISKGMGLLCNAKSTTDYIIDGSLSTIPAYDLVTTAGLDLNMIMHPLTKSSITTASGLGDDITVCNQVSKWDATNQGWVTATKGFFGWNGSFNCGITDPLLISVTSDITWPGAKGEIVAEPAKGVTTPKGSPRMIFVAVQNSSAANYDFSSPDSTVTFKCWIAERPTEIAHEFSFGAGYTMFSAVDTYSCLVYNIGNFPTAWAATETVMLSPKDEGEGTFQKVYYESNTGAASYVLDNTTNDIYIGMENDIPGTGPKLVLGTASNIESNIPMETKLEQNYPNPFNPTTAIKFSLKNDGVVKLNVYNYTGQLVNSLVNGQMNAGQHTVNFDASNLSAGVYYYTLETGNKTMTNKMVLVK